ncbi:MAG: thiosulfate oxidation carrier protein SoxY [Magnetovibrionaceae bacterium]
MTVQNASLKTTRRKALKGMAAVAAVAAAGPVLLQVKPLHATPEMAMDAVKKLVGKEPTQGKVDLELPEIAENGNTVPLAITVESPMTKDDYVAKIHVFADGNPTPDVASFYLSPMMGEASASTRLRLAGTQNVIAVAEMSNGDAFIASKEVKVTIGGCGG